MDSDGLVEDKGVWSVFAFSEAYPNMDEEDLVPKKRNDDTYFSTTSVLRPKDIIIYHKRNHHLSLVVSTRSFSIRVI